MKNFKYDPTFFSIMKVARNLGNMGFICPQWMLETGNDIFDLNAIIAWLGDRLTVEIDDSILNK